MCKIVNRLSERRISERCWRSCAGENQLFAGKKEITGSVRGKRKYQGFDTYIGRIGGKVFIGLSVEKIFYLKK